MTSRKTAAKETPVFKMETSRNKIGYITHAAKVNAGNPIDALETQSVKILYKNSGFKS